MANRIQLRRGTAAQWADANPILADGEPGIEKDTGKQKNGNGVTRWNSLPYTATKGEPGSNVLPTDDAIEQAILGGGTKTKAALSVTIDDKVSKSVFRSPAVATASIRSRGAFALHLDDGLPDQYTIAAPLIEQYGGRATFAICAQYSQWEVGTSTKMSWARIRDLAARGHEIANHSQTHTNMTTQTPLQRVTEWESSQSFIRDTIGVPTPSSFVLPNSAANSAFEQESLLRFDRVFGHTTYPWMERQGMTGHMHGRWGWASLTGGKGQRYMLALIRQAAATGSVLSAYTHNVNGSDPNGGITTAELEEALALASSLGMGITTASDALPAPFGIMDAGFEDSNLTFWDLSDVNGTNTVASVIDAPQVGFPGSRSLRISSTDGLRAPYAISQVAIPLGGESSYTFSARVRQEKSSGAAGVGGYIAVRQLNASGAKVGSDAISSQITTTGSTPWQQINATLVSPHADCRMIKLLCVQNQIVGETFFDHLHFGPTRLGLMG